MSDEVETVSIPVIEEQLKLDRETVETGRVKVRTVPQDRTERIAEPVLRTDVAVERIPMEREIEDVPAIRNEGDTIVVPVVEERIVRKLFLIEEVRLSRRASTGQVDQEIKLRSQRVIVEREESSGAPPTEDQE